MRGSFNTPTTVAKGRASNNRVYQAKQHYDGNNWVTDSAEYYFYGITGQKLGTFTATVSGSGTGTSMAWSAGVTQVFFKGKLIQKGGGNAQMDRLGSVGSYFPYGEDRTSTANDAVKFATYVRDSVSGMDYAKNRYHVPGLARFSSPDPYRASGGRGHPGSWNRYAYVEGDPIGSYDPRGLATSNPENPLDLCDLDDSGFDCDPTGYDIYGYPGGGGEGGGGGDSLVQAQEKERRKHYLDLIAGAVIWAKKQQASNANFLFPAYLRMYSCSTTTAPNAATELDIYYQLIGSDGKPYTSGAIIHEQVDVLTGTRPSSNVFVWTLNGNGVFTSPDAIAAGGILAFPVSWTATQAFYVVAPSLGGFPGLFYVPIQWPAQFAGASATTGPINVLDATFRSVTVNGYLPSNLGCR